MSNIKIERIFHPYWLWEDFHCGMYGKPMYDIISNGETEEERLNKVVECLGDTIKCEKYMRMVIDNWKFSCEYRLSNKGMNRVAWLGQSACCLYAGIKESETRKAWWMLSEEQRDKANSIAKQLINEWEVKHYGQ